MHRCLPAAFHLLNKAAANAFNEPGDLPQIRAATTCSGSGGLGPPCDICTCVTRGASQMMEYLDKRRHLSLQLSDESSPSQLWGKRCCLSASVDLRRLQLSSLNLTCLVLSTDRSWNLFFRIIKYSHWKLISLSEIADLWIAFQESKVIE